jgi:hypothetical protein
MKPDATLVDRIFKPLLMLTILATSLFSVIAIMKFSSTVLALCLLNSATAFVVQTPKSLSPVSLNAEQGVTEFFAATSTLNNAANAQQRAGSANYAPGRQQGLNMPGNDMHLAMGNIWDTASQIILQGGSLRTWSETTGSVERVQVLMRTEGRPLNANVELWHGPDNTPLKMAIYSEDGGLRPFNAVIETPTGQNTIAIRNTGQMEFPFTALVEPGVKDVAKILLDMGTTKTIQGGAILTFPFDHSVASVQVLLKTGGRPLNVRIELLQGPNNDKTVVDVYAEDGAERPFFAVIETPGTGNVVRIVNTASVEFPLTACVQAYALEPSTGSGDFGEKGWDIGGTGSFQSSRK